MNRNKFDIVITGSGFAGSIAALVLRKSGRKVCLIEKGVHPRFAIGESSTPAADMILRSLAQKYELPVLRQLSRYGSWQKHHPEILCGIKRGFSYFLHEPGKLFHSDPDHSRELLAAASSSDENSDTNWFRSDVDDFLVGECLKEGVVYREQTLIRSVRRRKDGRLELETAGSGKSRVNSTTSTKTADPGTTDSETTSVQCRWLIDASGSPRQACDFFGSKVTSDGFRTCSFALFSHFFDVKRWADHLRDLGVSLNEYPFDPDHAALHHWIEEGWMWNLRFNNGRTSAGFVIDQPPFPESSGTVSSPSGPLTPDSSPERKWRELIGRYPSLTCCFRESRRASEPGRIIQTGRLQRRMQPMCGDNWVALNHTAGFVDPLHSTGIAHSLSGLERILDLFTGTNHTPKELQETLTAHQEIFYRELELIDLLVACCYRSRWNRPLFQASVILYFTCTILYERQRLSGEPAGSFLCADHEPLFRIAKEMFDELVSLNRNPVNAEDLALRVKERIRPFDSAGLLNPENRNMFHHTAVSL